MSRTVVRWVSLVALCFPVAAAAAHVLELPNKLVLDGPLWLAVQQHLYRGWGTFIGPIEVLALLSTWALVFLVRDRRPVLALTVTAAFCLTGMLAVFFALNAPVNAAVAHWTPDTMPADWPEYRIRWELGHALAFALGMTALISLLRATFVDGVAAAKAQPTSRRPLLFPVPATRRRLMRSRGVVSLRTARE